MKSEQRRISVSPAQFKVRETNISTGPHDGGRSPTRVMDSPANPWTGIAY
jgi:hypothetical protein